MNAIRIRELLEAYVPSDRANQLATVLHEDMTLIGFTLAEATFTPREFWKQHGIIPQAEYQLPANQFGINSGPKDDSEFLEGSFLTCGNLLRLAQCAILGRRYIPALWPGGFASHLHGRQHLDALNEIWWLKFWRGIEKVERGPNQSGNDPDFEWQISVRDGPAKCVINLEVKRRTSNINQFFKTQNPKASVSKIAKKFGPTNDGTANIAALTLYHSVSPEVDRAVRTWLDTQSHLHGLLIWTEGNFGGIALKKFFKQSQRWAEFLLNEPEPEDLKVAGHSSGTLCKAQDMPSFIQRLLASDEDFVT